MLKAWLAVAWGSPLPGTGTAAEPSVPFTEGAATVPSRGHQMREGRETQVKDEMNQNKLKMPRGDLPRAQIQANTELCKT